MTCLRGEDTFLLSSPGGGCAALDMEPNNFETTDGGMLTSLSCVEGYFSVVSLQEKPIRILFTTQVRDSVIPGLKLLYTPVPWKFFMCTPISIPQEEKKRVASCRVSRLFTG